MSAFSFVIKKGAEIGTVFEDLAQLRITVFHDFPYLYEGSVAYEQEYLKTYSRSEGSFLFAVYRDGKMVGATTCIPLADETEEVKEPFIKGNFDIARIFYFGESILLPEFRGHGLGHRFFDEREQHARSFNSYQLTCFCSVDRGANHPGTPAGYRPNDAFWSKRGYSREPDLQSIMEWPDIGETKSSEKKMVFWVKSLI